jgi:hypothetical protein
MVRSMRGAILEARQPPPRTHLERALIEAMPDYIDAG